MQPQNGEEKRQSPRIHIPVYIKTFSESFPAGTLVNISMEGMFVQSTEPKEVGTKMDLRFQPPEIEETILVAAEVIRVCHPPFFKEDEDYTPPEGPVTDNPGMGLKILSMDPKSKALLETFIQSMKEDKDDDR